MNGTNSTNPFRVHLNVLSVVRAMGLSWTWRIRGGSGQPYFVLQSGVGPVVLWSSARRSDGLSPCIGKGVGVGGGSTWKNFDPPMFRGVGGGVLDCTVQVNVEH